MAFIAVTDHVERALGRVAQQFKGKARFNAILAALAARAQSVDDQILLLSYVDIDLLSGESLTLLGRLVGQNREEMIDEDLRNYIRARIGANRSSGSVVDLKRTLKLVLPSNAVVTIREWYPAAFEAEVSVASVGSVLANLCTKFVRLLRAAGVRGIFRWQHNGDALTFSFFGGPGAGFGDATDANVGGRLQGAAE